MAYGGTILLDLFCHLWLDGVGQVQGCLSFAAGYGAGGLVASGLDSVNCRYVVGLVDCFWWYNGEKTPGPGPC